MAVFGRHELERSLVIGHPQMTVGVIVPHPRVKLPRYVPNHHAVTSPCVGLDGKRRSES